MCLYIQGALNGHASISNTGSFTGNLCVCGTDRCNANIDTLLSQVPDDGGDDNNNNNNDNNNNSAGSKQRLCGLLVAFTVLAVNLILNV